MKFNISKALNFVEAARKKGYQIKDSALRIDYTGEYWRVGFWIRPNNWIEEKQCYDLPGLCGSAKHANLDEAIRLAIIKVSK
jgi:hypothetical protein